VEPLAEPFTACPTPDQAGTSPFQLPEGLSLAEALGPQISAYLNACAGSQGLEAALSSPIPSQGGQYPANSEVYSVDVTGDAALEVVVDFNLVLGYENVEGVLFVYANQAGEYRMLTAKPYFGYVFSEDSPDPGVRAIQDLNADGVPEIVISYILVVGTHANYSRIFEIISWDGGQFVGLIGGSAEVFNGDGRVRDLDADGLFELVLAHKPGRGFEVSALDRPRTDVWAWDGDAYTLSYSQADSPPDFRIQAVWDGDDATHRDDYDAALAFYQQAVFDQELFGWSSDRVASDAAYEGGATPTPDPNEQPLLAAYGRYRIMLLHAARGYLNEAQVVYDTLLAKFPPDSVGGQYGQLASAFWGTFTGNEDLAMACESAINYASAHGDEILRPLGRDYYGFVARDYTPEDICPFAAGLGD
jgi:hypothetical protein